MKKLLYTLIILLSLSGWTFGATYWVSTTGTATWANCQSATKLTGTSACSMTTANANADDDDIAVFNDGDYSTELNPANSGSSGHPITFQSLYEWSSHTDGTEHGAKLEGTYGINLMNGQDWLVFDGFGRDNSNTQAHIIAWDSDNVKLKNSYFRVNGYTGWTSIQLTGASGSGQACDNWEIDTCKFDVINAGSATDEIMIFGTYQNRGSGFYIHDSIFVDALGHGALIFTNSENIVVYNNTFYSTGVDTLNTGYGYFICAVAGVKNLVIENNLFYEGTADRYDETRHVFHAHELTQSIFRGNKSGWMDGRGISAFTSSDWSPNNNYSYNSFYHNTFYRTGMDRWSSSGEYSGGIVFNAFTANYITRNRFVNNIIHTISDTATSWVYPIALWEDPSASGYITENKFYGNLFYNIYNSYDVRRDLVASDTQKTIAEAESAFSLEFYDNITTRQDPLLSDPSNYDFTLQSGSPCINQAQPLTYTNGASSGTSMDVDDYTAYMFQALSITGWSKDTIYVDNPSSADFSVQLSAIVDHNTLTLSESKPWDDNAKVYWCPQGVCFSGSAPDIGAEEFVGIYNVSPADGETGVSLTKVATWGSAHATDDVYLTQSACPANCTDLRSDNDSDNQYDMTTVINGQTNTVFCLGFKPDGGAEDCEEYEFTTAGGPPTVTTSFRSILIK